ncbi:hypothetical protein Tsubulata_039473 [Turnera subulata]|uniref:Uncharacterized protein n=1 Tax=Turnera subulata TaxID=218843 RepID=A0A9Q0IZU1_9ROSI|nr:hypothetical protein Tsubulata_039473 [Turnera subulata]
MLISKGQVVGCYLLLILLSFSALQETLGARLLQMKVEDMKKHNQEQDSNINDVSGVGAGVDRKVPSGPDPTHNK